MPDETKPAPTATPEQALMQFALSNPNTPRVYGNVFQLFANTHDVSTLFTVNGVPSGILLMTYPFAKEFAASLNELVVRYEELTKTQVPLISDLDKALKPVAGQQFVQK